MPFQCNQQFCQQLTYRAIKPLKWYNNAVINGGRIERTKMPPVDLLLGTQSQQPSTAPIELLIVNCSETQLIHTGPSFLIAGDRPHECEICQKRFALQCNLRAHMKTHEEPQNEKCLRCSREYPISTGLVTMGCCHECYLNNQGIPLLRQK